MRVVVKESDDRRMRLSAEEVRRFRTTVYRHFRLNGRDLPWRHTSDPYHIFVSEIMLQQTQVDRVIEKYREFLRCFPTFSVLAQSPLQEVLRTWQGLGYNRRGFYLWKSAQVVESRHGGRLPSETSELLELPGIGPATAASICAFAFDRPVVFIETNIRSVFLHHFFPDCAGVPDARIVPLVEQSLDRRHPCRWYSALMDYGTVLKRLHPNPSRRSAHHSSQSPFQGSRRQLRGALLKRVISRPGISPRQAGRELGRSVEEIRSVARDLAGEGIIELKNTSMRVTATTTATVEADT